MATSRPFTLERPGSSPASAPRVHRSVASLAQLPQMEREPEDVNTIPAHLQRKIKTAQKVDPTLPWDAALPQVVARKAA